MLTLRGLQDGEKYRMLLASLHCTAFIRSTLYALSSHQIHTNEPIWFSPYRLNCAKPPTDICRWLLDQGSLTQRLVAATRGNFRVAVLNAAWGTAGFSESKLLGLKNREAVFVREVILYCNNQPWVFARSVLPHRFLHTKNRHLRKLHSRPLGEVLFASVGMQREDFEIARISSKQLNLPESLQQQSIFWGRRCRFELNNQPLMVSEIFLDDFRPWD